MSTKDTTDIDNVSTTLNSLTLDDSDKSIISFHFLYVDILNYGQYFFPMNRSWNISNAYNLVKEFIQAADQSNLKLKIFIDDAVPSDEATRKWKSRRAAEVIKGIKNMPQGLSILLGDMFRSLGIEVHYSDEYDNDDTLAIFAHLDNAFILSGITI